MDDDPASKKTGHATVRVFMENLNDEPPEFPEVMSTELRYDASVGADVFRVQGTDKDDGDVLSYIIESGGKYLWKVVVKTSLTLLFSNTVSVYCRNTVVV